MHGRTSSTRALTALIIIIALPRVAVRAQDHDGEKDDVQKRQVGIAHNYEDLENKIKQIAVAISRTDPEKAARLQRAYAASRDEEVTERLDEVMRLLKKKDYATANVAQKEIVDAIERILEILESDDAKKNDKLDPKRLEALQKELKKLIEQEQKHKEASAKAKDLEAQAQALEAAAKKVRELIEAQRKQIAATQDAKADTMPNAAAEQRAIDQKTQDLAKELDQVAKDLEAKPGDAKPADGKPSDGKPSDGKPSDGKPSDGQSGPIPQAAQGLRDASGAMAQAAKKLDEKQKDPALERERKALERLEEAKKALEEKRMEVERLAQFEKMKAEQAQTQRDASDLEKKMGPEKSSEGKSGGKEGKPSESQGGEVPGRRNVQRAEDEMKRAGDDLENRHASKAEEKQDAALEELKKAEEELREALIQARKREQEEVLAALGKRFQAMLEKQKDITKRTEVVDAERAEKAEKGATTETVALTRKQIIEVGKLATGEGELRDDANGALDMIREEGSTAILPTVVSEVALDLAKLASLLDKRDTGKFVVGLQHDVERSLEELIEVIKKEIEERKNGGGGGGGGGGGEQEDPLLPPSAELKMIRAQQVRVNSKTKEFDVGRATPEKDLSNDQREACRHIAEKQGRVAEFTRKLHMKLNKEE